MFKKITEYSSYKEWAEDNPDDALELQRSIIREHGEQFTDSHLARLAVEKWHIMLLRTMEDDGMVVVLDDGKVCLTAKGVREITNDDVERRPPRNAKVKQCIAPRCIALAMRGSDPPLCKSHKKRLGI